MDQSHDLDIDLKITNKWPVLDAKLTEAGGVPVVIIPLDTARKALVQGRACATPEEYRNLIRWAYTVSPDHIVRIIPVMPQHP